MLKFRDIQNAHEFNDNERTLKPSLVDPLHAFSMEEKVLNYLRGDTSDVRSDMIFDDEGDDDDFDVKIHETRGFDPSSVPTGYSFVPSSSSSNLDTSEEVSERSQRDKVEVESLVKNENIESSDDA